MNITVRYNFSCHSLNQAYYFLKNVNYQKKIKFRVKYLALKYSILEPNPTIRVYS
jgi:acyl-CoA thioesterase